MALSQVNDRTISQITENIIKSVRKKPLLYNPEHPFYRCRKSRAAAWNVVAQEVYLKNGHVAKTKWRNIKDCYLKHIRAHQRPSSDMQQKRLSVYKRFRWASELEFMKQYLRSRQRISGITLGKPKIEKNYGDDSDDQHQDIEEYYLDETENFAGNSDSIDPNVMEPSVFLQVKEKSTNDGIYHLFQSYADTFRKFSPRRQALMKVELAKLFSGAEMDELEENKNILNGFISD